MGLHGKMATHGNYYSYSPIKNFTEATCTCAVKTCFIGISGDDKSINGEIFIILRQETAILALQLQNNYFNFSQQLNV